MWPPRGLQPDSTSCASAFNLKGLGAPAHFGFKAPASHNWGQAVQMLKTTPLGTSLVIIGARCSRCSKTNQNPEACSGHIWGQGAEVLEINLSRPLWLYQEPGYPGTQNDALKPILATFPQVFCFKPSGAPLPKQGSPDPLRTTLPPKMEVTDTCITGGW